MKVKKKLGNLVRKLLRKAACTNIGHHLIMEEALNLLANPEKYSGKKWQNTDKFYSIARRHLTANEYWIPGPKRTRKLAHKYFEQLGELPLDRSKPFLDLGCGPRTPFGIGMIFWLNGWNECWALDIEPFNPQRASEAIADLLKDVLLNPDSFAFIESSEEIVRRVRHFNVDALENGNLEEGLNGANFRHVVSDIVDFKNLNGAPKFGTICSHTVVEHLMDLQAAMKSMKSISADGAFHYHYIDFVDHRAYSFPGKFDWWSFLENPKSEADKISNKVRCSDMKHRILDASFQIIDWTSESSELPANIRDRIHESWQSISDQDLETLRVNVIMKA